MIEREWVWTCEVDVLSSNNVNEESTTKFSRLAYIGVTSHS